MHAGVAACGGKRSTPHGVAAAAQARTDAAMPIFRVDAQCSTRTGKKYTCVWLMRSVAVGREINILVSANLRFH